MPKRIRSDYLSVAGKLLACLDLVMIMASSYLTAVAYVFFFPESDLLSNYFSDAGRLTLIGALLAPVMLRETFITSVQHAGPKRGLIQRTLLRALYLVGILLAIGFLTRGLSVPRSWLAAWCVTFVVVSIAGRLLLMHHIGEMIRNGVICEQVALIGAGPISDRLAHHLEQKRGTGVSLMGIFDEGVSRSVGGPMFLGNIGHLLELGKRAAPDWVIITSPQDDRLPVEELVCRLKALDVNIALCPPFPAHTIYPCELDVVADVPLLILAHRPIRRWGLVAKWIEDKVIALLLLILLAPLLAAVCAAIAIDSPGPIVFRQRRHGCNNSEFEVLKFRTMKWQGPEASNGMRQTERHDPRITGIGKFLRASSIDELPQLINVLRGEMSIVGPRPHPVMMRTEERSCQDIIVEYAHRHRVKPGITGWAQINGHRGATKTAEQVRKRVEFDLAYIENWSMMLDLKILFLTPYSLLFSRDNAF